MYKNNQNQNTVDPNINLFQNIKKGLLSLPKFPQIYQYVQQVNKKMHPKV